ncbi:MULTISPECIES: flagellar motor switch protein FliN [unclassified Desulfovibrio]|uniref:flagellar motor switch protein FliN n=1 Tax=unclassified Desulfovibrio TaxID=2593640 RepID=UPI000F5FCF19|nr:MULTISPECIES: flagellar motor switch protein FliN [unclassified Desulfovibrio]RRD71415.1 flagellar motor switch protein FliN [Desulfovibrio sp. OH1209_COT-279]RRD87685.1 flagellar motor switch protein FliN [Desulfovibrio sp. OH1186_COT-070]
MSQDDQEALAAQWAAQLEEDEADAAQDTAPALPSGQSALDDEALAAQWAEALANEEAPDISPTAGNLRSGSGAADANFQDMTDVARQPRDSKLKRELDFILDIPLDVSAELGRTRLLINELLQLGQGSVVELNKLAGEPLEVYVNGKLVARGEAVVINEKFGVRLTDIISPIERVKQLG